MQYKESNVCVEPKVGIVFVCNLAYFVFAKVLVQDHKSISSHFFLVVTAEKSKGNEVYDL